MKEAIQNITSNSTRIRYILLCLLLLLLPFELYPRVELYGVAVRLSQVVGVLLIVLCVPLVIKNWRDWLSNPWVLLALFVVASTISALLALNKSKGLLVTSFYAFDFVLAYAVAQTFSLRHSEVFKKIIFGMGLAVVAFCLYQFVGDTLGLSNNYTLLNVRYTKLIFGFPRVQGFSLEPLYLANYLLIPFCLALTSYIFSNKKLEAVLAFVFLTTIWITVARGAYLGVFAVLIILGAVLIYQKKWRQLGVALGIVVVSLVLAFGMIRASGMFAKQIPASTNVPNNLQTNIPQQGIDAQGNTERLLEHTTDFTSETSVSDRLQSSKTAIALVQSNPILGVGPGNFGRYVVKAYPAVFVDPNQIANNETLEILAEVGILGFALLATFALTLLWRGLHFSVKQNSNEANIWFFATAAMLVAFVIQWQTFSTLYVTHIWVMIGVYMAVLSQSKFTQSTKLRTAINEYKKAQS